MPTELDNAEWKKVLFSLKPEQESHEKWMCLAFLCIDDTEKLLIAIEWLLAINKDIDFKNLFRYFVIMNIDDHSMRQEFYNKLKSLSQPLYDKASSIEELQAQNASSPFDASQIPRLSATLFQENFVTLTTLYTLHELIEQSEITPDVVELLCKKITTADKQLSFLKTILQLQHEQMNSWLEELARYYQKPKMIKAYCDIITRCPAYFWLLSYLHPSARLEVLKKLKLNQAIERFLASDLSRSLPTKIYLLCKTYFAMQETNPDEEESLAELQSAIVRALNELIKASNGQPLELDERLSDSLRSSGIYDLLALQLQELSVALEKTMETCLELSTITEEWSKHEQKRSVYKGLFPQLRYEAYPFTLYELMATYLEYCFKKEKTNLTVAFERIKHYLIETKSIAEQEITPYWHKTLKAAFSLSDNRELQEFVTSELDKAQVTIPDSTPWYRSDGQHSCVIMILLRKNIKSLEYLSEKKGRDVVLSLEALGSSHLLDKTLAEAAATAEARTIVEKILMSLTAYDNILVSDALTIATGNSTESAIIIQRMLSGHHPLITAQAISNALPTIASGEQLDIVEIMLKDNPLLITPNVISGALEIIISKGQRDIIEKVLNSKHRFITTTVIFDALQRIVYISSNQEEWGIIEGILSRSQPEVISKLLPTIAARGKFDIVKRIMQGNSYHFTHKVIFHVLRRAAAMNEEEGGQFVDEILNLTNDKQSAVDYVLEEAAGNFDWPLVNSILRSDNTPNAKAVYVTLQKASEKKEFGIVDKILSFTDNRQLPAKKIFEHFPEAYDIIYTLDQAELRMTMSLVKDVKKIQDALCAGETSLSSFFHLDCFQCDINAENQYLIAFKFFHFMADNPKSTLVRAWNIYCDSAIKDNVSGSNVTLLKAVHTNALQHSNFFSKTHVAAEDADEAFTNPQEGTRRAKILSALRR